jgi:hypothetical protein
MKVRPQDYLHGTSPSVKAEQNKLIAFQHIYNFGYSTDQLITALLGKKATGWAATQVKSGWLRRTDFEAFLHGPLFTLSNRGLEWIEEMIDFIHPYPEANPHKIHQALIKHNLFAQRFLIESYTRDYLVGSFTERQYATLDTQGAKRPDMIFHHFELGVVAIEIELSPKWERRLDDFVIRIVRDLGYFNNEEEKYSSYCIVSKSAALLNNYREAFSPGSNINEWYKDHKSELICECVGKINQRLSSRIYFIHESDLTIRQKLPPTLVSDSCFAADDPCR